jgi:NAD(P)-dependent dehydrogenase (short-subunit alcohol dehydrogenase family)
MEVKDKVIIVTGSSSGIGKDCALQLAKLGANVIITYNKNKKDAEKFYGECKKLAQCMLIKLDLTNESSIKKLISAVIKKFERLDVLVNNAGVFYYNSFDKISTEQIKEQVDVNLTGLILMTKHALPHLIKQTDPVIINISSISGKFAYEKEAPYCATKFGVRGFTQAIALEYPKIRIISVNPSSTATKMNDFQGAPIPAVATVIVKTIEGQFGKKSGDDVDVERYL